MSIIHGVSDSERPASEIQSLLEPSLEAGAAPVPLYSPNAGFMVAFFGGPFAICCFSGLNSARLGRLGRDLWLYLIVAIVAAAVGGWLAHATAAGTSPELLGFAGTPARSARLILRGFSLLVFGLFYLRLRPFYKATALADLGRPNPWPAGLACLGIGLVVSIGVAALGAALWSPR